MKQSRNVTIMVKDRTLAQRLASILELEGFRVNIASRVPERRGVAPGHSDETAQSNPLSGSSAVSLVRNLDSNGAPLERPYGLCNIGPLSALH